MTTQSQPAPHRPTARSAGTAPHRRRPAGRARSLFVLRTVVAVVIALVVIAPLYWMVVVAFSPRSELLGGTVRFFPRTLTTQNLDRVFSSFPVVEWLGNEAYAYIPFEAPPEVQAQLDQLEKDLDGEAMRTQLVVALDASSRIQKGEDATIWVDARRMHLFDPKTGENLTHGL